MAKIRIDTQKAAFHLLAWAAVFFISTILIPGYSLRVGAVNTLVSWVFYAFIFYINYLLLIPRFFTRQWAPVYAVLALAVLFGSFVCIRYTAVETARETTMTLGDRLEEYEDVRDSFEEKERLGGLQRNIERRREWENDLPGGVPPPGRRPDRGRETDRGREWPVPRALDELVPAPDSASALYRQRIEWVQDSILALDVALTPREEEYGQLRYEYEGFRFYYRFLSQSDYNPFLQYNLSFVFALILFYMAAILVYFAEQSGKAEKRRQEVEQERVRAELAYLKQQINPHFLFNTLNAIYSYTIGVSGEASDVVLKLSSILRYMLYETRRNRVPLPDELAVMSDYIELQRLRITEQTAVEVLVSGDPTPHLIEPMLLIPIVENAFKYGVDSVDPSFVRIEAAVEGYRLVFRVTNRIVRWNEEDHDHSGIGIQNIRRRLELIYGPGHYELTTGEKAGVFSVVLQLDLKE